MSTKEATLVLGPILRYVDGTTATVWVETSAPAVVRVLGRSARTFSIEDHHYALVVVNKLEPGSETEYSVDLDGRTVWPEAGDRRPAPRIRTLAEDRSLDIVFGSCRIDRPSVEPWNLEHGKAPEAVGVDALIALSHAIQSGKRPLPDLMLMLGDQIYADKRLAPEVRERMARDAPPGTPPPGEACNFEEYTWVYQNSWVQDDVRWLLATAPSAMIFDDHEVRNNWNISAAWRREVTPSPGWQERITGAYMAYWLYQHLGNLSPAALEEEGLWPALTKSSEGQTRLREFARHADDEVNGRKRSRWSYSRELGRTRLVVVDTRSGRILETSDRDMVSEPEWDVIDDWLRGDCEHLLIASSLPLLLERSLHDVEAWNEAVAAGVSGPRMAGWAERLRRVGNLEHWAAFQHSFRRFTAAVEEVAAGRRGRVPSTVLILSGDVHHSYVAQLAKPKGAQTTVVQVVSSPLRNELPGVMRWLFTVADSGPARLIGRLLRRSAGVPPRSASWSVTTGPLFGNFAASLQLGPGRADLRLERAEQHNDRPGLRVVHHEALVSKDR